MSTASINSDDQLKAEAVVTEKGGHGVPVDMNFLSHLEHFSDGSFTADDIEIIAAHIDDHSIEECMQILRDAIELHNGDVCLTNTYYQHLLNLEKGPAEGQTEDEWEAIVKFDCFLIHDWSIYTSVRSVTRPIDEEEFDNYENIRVYLLSILWGCAGSTLATFFAPRFPSIQMNSVAIQMLIAYSGRLVAYIPDWSFPVGFGRRVHFGGGKWNYKEQMLATAGMGTGNQTPYSQYVVITMANNHFYGFKQAKNNFGFTIMLTLATNLMGFGLAGIFRVFLVYPVRLVWFSVLPSLRLSRILIAPEPRETIDGWRLKSYEFFWIAVVLFFGWYWITDFVIMFFSTFDWVAWISHKDNDMLSVCGVNLGLGLNPFPSLDPSIFTMSAMYQPFFATVSMICGMFFSFFVILGVFYNNISWAGYITINDNTLYDRFGEPWNVSRVLNSNHLLDAQSYLNYSMPFWSAGNLVMYGAFFAFYPAMIMYALLNYGDIMFYSLKIFGKTLIHPGRTLSSFNDRFTRAQRKYKEVPEWWYIFTLAACLGLGIACVEHYKFTNTPVWTIFFGIGLSFVFMVPCGVLYATTGQSVVINVLYELIIGITNQGNGTALMVAKAFATNFMVETDTFISNLKTAHYVGLAPRAMFRVQIINCICNSFVQSGLMTWQSQDGAIKDMCSEEARYTSKFTCQDQRTYFNAAIQWGTIGPKRVLRDLYPRMRWTFLAGALYPIPFWLVRKFLIPQARKLNWGTFKEGGSKFRNSEFVRSFLDLEWMNSFNEIVVVTGMLNWAPSNFMYYLPWLYIGFVFQWYLPRYHIRWWHKYNYVLYAAISVGYSFGGLIVFFATEYTHIASINWWMNDKAISLTPGPNLTPPADGFGPAHWRL